MSNTGVFLFVIVAVIFCFFVMGIFRAKREDKERRERLKKSFGKLPEHRYSPEQIARIPRYFEKHIPADVRSGFLQEAGSNDPGLRYVIDDITANDLDLWSLFARVSFCQSAAGEEVLYHLLRTPVYDGETLAGREEEIRLFTENGALRLNLQMALHRLGGSGKYSVYDYLDTLSLVKERSNLPHFIGILALVVSLVLLPFYFTIGFPALLITVTFQIITYYRVKSESDAYLSVFSYILRLIRCGESMLGSFSRAGGLPEATRERNQDLGEAMQALRGFKKGSGVLMNSARMSGSGNPLDILSDYIRMLFHIDLIKFNQMVREAGKHADDIDRLITDVGMTEALISAACYRASVPGTPAGENGYCIPETQEDPAGAMQVENLRHPLMDRDAVPNSLSTVRCILLTGSNASGKSTWLKTLGLSAVMAQTIHTVTGAAYRAPLFRIFSSMALSDDLAEGESYYVVEIRALSRVLNAAAEKNAPPVLALVDEVLRGTNTVERIAASAQILKHFSGQRVLLFAATHDLELSELLKDRFDNYHFEGTLDEEDVHFDYRLRAGASTTRNAIGLLRRFSYDRRITESAETMAARFMKTGTWSMEAEGSAGAVEGDSGTMSGGTA